MLGSVSAELSPGSTANKGAGSVLHKCPSLAVRRSPGIGQSGAGSSGGLPGRANRLRAKGRQPEKVLPQAAETAVIYHHLYAATSKRDGKGEAAGCWSAWSVAEIKGDAMGCHVPLPASAPTDILARKGSPGGETESG